MSQYLQYRSDLEKPAADESETIQKIIDVMLKGQHNVREKYGTSVRVSHAKAHGFLKGQLVVAENLPGELAQGLFARAGAHPVIVRMAQAPGEMLDDRQVSSPRGLAIKVFNVEGAKLAGHESASTQDFVLDTGKKEFFAADMKAFLSAFTPNATIAPKLPEGVKGAVSKTAQAANAILSAFGGNSGKLDFFGHPPYHPLGESYFSQVPIRWGDYVAKIAVTPATEPLRALFEQKVEMDSEDAIRSAVRRYFQENAAEFEVSVQLAIDPDKTSIEDATAQWPEDLSPYRSVGRLVLPAQNAFSQGRQEFVDYHLSFSPGHSLATHRPLGSIMRARLAVYPVVSQARQQENKKNPVEPASIDEIPD